MDLLKQNKTFSIIDAKKYMLQLIEAMLYLRSKLIVHRDLKLSNLLLNENNQLKLADFGISKKLNFEYEIIRESAGTPN